MSGQAHNRPIGRFALFAPTTSYRGLPRHCSLIGASVLVHSADKQAVAETVRTDTKTRTLLCEHCRSYVEAYHWAAGQGLVIKSETLLSALAMVWRSELGYQMGPVNQWRGSQVHLWRLGHNLKSLVLSGHLQKIGTRYLMRDACPSCFRRGGCAADLSCPGSSRCVDAAFVFDPEGSRLGTDTSGTPFYEAPSGDRYYILHDAVCVGK